MSESRPAAAPYCRCFRCSEGCIHLSVGNTTLTLTPCQFLMLVEVVNALYQQMQQENEATAAEAQAEAALLIM
jgi:hypothetical protein